MSDELIGQNVSRETYDKLRAYEALIQKWNPSINLVAKSTLSDVGTGTLSILRKFTLLLLAKNHQFGRISVLVVDCLVLYRHTGTGRRSANQCNDG